MDAKVRTTVLSRLAIAVQSLRKSKKLSQRELGELIGCEAGTISQWENGKNFPKAEYLFAIADLKKEPWERFVQYLRTGEEAQLEISLVEHLNQCSKEELTEVLKLAMELLLKD